MNEKKLNKRMENLDKERTVGNLISALKTLPSDCHVDINGSINIKGIDVDGDSATLSISNAKDAPAEVVSTETFPDDPFSCCGDKDACEDNCKPDPVLATYLDGLGAEVSDAIRHTSSDLLYENPICYPNALTQSYEAGALTPAQKHMIGEIREKNAFMADVLAEQFRRSLAAMFEYNTQCMYMYGHTMCSIVDPDDKDEF